MRQSVVWFGFLSLSGALLAAQGCGGSGSPPDATTGGEAGAQGEGGAEAQAGGSSHPVGHAGSGGGSADGGEAACEDGALGCPCYGNGTCAIGLRCEDDICRDCTDGAERCPCHGDGTCESGLVCEDDMCVAGRVGSGGSSGTDSGGAGGETGSPGGTGGSTAGSGGESGAPGGAGGVTAGSAGAGGAPGGTAGVTGGTGGDTGGSAGTGGATGGTGGDTGGSGGESGGTPCPDGTVGCPCYGNGTCNEGLSCSVDTCVVPDFCNPDTVIDDMEDGDGGICENAGRGGGWYVVKGASGSTNPAANTEFGAFVLGSDARAGSAYGMRLSGTGFAPTDDWEEWVVLGVSLHDNGLYDATVHNGIRFWAKATAALKIRVNVSTTNTRTTANGGDCLPDGETPCGDYYGRLLDFSTSWQLYSVQFSVMTQAGWGVPAVFDLDEVWTIEFVYTRLSEEDGVAYENPSSFEFLVDDLEFL